VFPPRVVAVVAVSAAAAVVFVFTRTPVPMSPPLDHHPRTTINFYFLLHLGRRPIWLPRGDEPVVRKFFFFENVRFENFTTSAPSARGMREKIRAGGCRSSAKIKSSKCRPVLRKKAHPLGRAVLSRVARGRTGGCSGVCLLLNECETCLSRAYRRYRGSFFR